MATPPMSLAAGTPQAPAMPVTTSSGSAPVDVLLKALDGDASNTLRDAVKEGVIAGMAHRPVTVNIYGAGGGMESYPGELDESGEVNVDLLDLMGQRQ